LLFTVAYLNNVAKWQIQSLIHVLSLRTLFLYKHTPLRNNRNMSCSFTSTTCQLMTFCFDMYFYNVIKSPRNHHTMGCSYIAIRCQCHSAFTCQTDSCLPCPQMVCLIRGNLGSDELYFIEANSIFIFLCLTNIVPGSSCRPLLFNTRNKKRTLF